MEIPETQWKYYGNTKEIPGKAKMRQASRKTTGRAAQGACQLLLSSRSRRHRVPVASLPRL